MPENKVRVVTDKQFERIVKIFKNYTEVRTEVDAELKAKESDTGKWTCRAYPKVAYSGDEYYRVNASFYGSDSKLRFAKKKAKKTCVSKTNSRCKLYTCENSETRQGISYGGAIPY